MTILCPICKIPLEKLKYHGIEANQCLSCFGIWFKKDQLRKSKDKRDKSLNWVDVDLWEKEAEFQISRGRRLCPACEVPLYEVGYSDSDIRVDVCELCHGIWLDRGEFRKIIDYLKKKANYEILHNYMKVLIEETKEIFTGPETLKSEITDFLTVIKLFKYKFITQFPTLTKIFLNLPK